MQTSSDLKVLNIFSYYRNSMFSISNDLIFWNISLENMIKDYPENPAFRNQDVFQSIFCVNNLPSKPYENSVKVYNGSFSVKTNELIEYKNDFFQWIRNISILKAYNSCELLILRSIQLKYFPSLEDPLKNRKSAKKVEKEIKNFISEFDSVNNRHLIKFIQIKSSEFKSFSNDPVRMDRNTTWKSFFESFSIIRNTIAHNNSILSEDSLNQLRQTSRDIFEYHFDLKKDDNNFNHLLPKGGDYFSNFLDLINDFSINTSKFIFEESDLRFLDMN
jgi:hypothetical protein